MNHWPGEHSFGRASGISIVAMASMATADTLTSLVQKGGGESEAMHGGLLIARPTVTQSICDTHYVITNNLIVMWLFCSAALPIMWESEPHAY